MFRGEIVWRGFVYAILMAFGKLLTGLWLVRFSMEPIYPLLKKLKSVPLIKLAFCEGLLKPRANQNHRTPAERDQTRHVSKTAQDQTGGDKANQEMEPNSNLKRQEGEASNSTPSQEAPTSTEPVSTSLSLPPKPKSLYPPSILGLSMVARGEIGYLIASIAETNGIFSQQHSSSGGGSSQIYLVVIWAITLCTFVGPMSVGTLVRRVKKLQKQRKRSGGPDPLGVWGI